MSSNLIRSTSRLITRFGKLVNYIRVTEGTYNVNTGLITGASNGTAISVKGYRTKVSYSESQNPNLVGKDAAVYLFAGLSLNFVPDVGDRITDSSDSSDYQVLAVTKVYVADTVALWRLVCIRG